MHHALVYILWRISLITKVKGTRRYEHTINMVVVTAFGRSDVEFGCLVVSQYLNGSKLVAKSTPIILCALCLPPGWPSVAFGSIDYIFGYVFFCTKLSTTPETTCSRKSTSTYLVSIICKAVGPYYL